MQNYMLTVLVKNGVDEKDRVALLDGIKKQFGNLKKEDLWGNKGLAYQIKHQDKAFYAHFEFEAEPASILSIDKSIKLNEDIVRYLLTRVELPKKAPKVKKQVKTEAVTEEKVEETVANAEKEVAEAEVTPDEVKE